MNIGPDHYRYSSHLAPEGVQLICQKFVVVGETPRCYYVIPKWAQGFDAEYVRTHRRRVLKDSSKRYCYPDRKDALHSFLQRQRWRESRAKEQLSCAQLSARKASAMLEAGEIPVEPINCGHDEHTGNLRFVEY